MTAGKPARLCGVAVPCVALLVLVASIPLALLLGSLPLTSRARLPLLKRFLVDGGHAATLQPRSQGASVLPEDHAGHRQRCAIFNGVNFHMDVTAGLAWAFQEAGCDTNVYMHQSAQGLQDVMEGWLRGRLLRREQMEADQSQYDVLVLVTFPEGPTQQDRQNRLLLSRPPGQRILLGVHNPGWLLHNAGQLVPPLLLAQAMPHSGSAPGQRLLPPPVQLLSLAPLGATYSRSLLQSWLADMQGWAPELAHVQVRVEVPWIAPLVPWAPSDTASGSSGSGDSSGTGSSSGGWNEGEEDSYTGRLQHLCIQGTIHPKRRDYESAFAAAAHPAVLAQLRRRKEKLLLVGSSRLPPPIPAPLQPFVKTLSSLSYSDYYDTLSRCRAILTAFHSDQYLVNKTSSTLAAALQVGAPLLTEDRVLAAYQYVPRAAAFLHRPLNDTAQPDPAALAAAEGKRLSQWMRQQAEARQLLVQKQAGAAQRRLMDLQDAAEEQRQREEEEEDGEPADSAEQEGRHQQRAGTFIAAPAPGSYAAAMLQAFDDSAARAAHAAAWRAKRTVMQRTAEAARRVLQETAALAAAARAAR
ncbi:hypothetical protein ABPG75_008492 [Micractinium tetrahymenae]